MNTINFPARCIIPPGHKLYNNLRHAHGINADEFHLSRARPQSDWLAVAVDPTTLLARAVYKINTRSAWMPVRPATLGHENAISRRGWIFGREQTQLLTSFDASVTSSAMADCDEFREQHRVAKQRAHSMRKMFARLADTDEAQAAA